MSSVKSVRVEPSSEDLRIDSIVQVDDIAGAELLKHLSIRYIDVTDSDSLWTITVNASDPTRWNKAAKAHEKGTLDMLLATVRQEIKKQVEGLENVRWIVPEELGKVFKDPQPEENEPPRRRRGSSQPKAPLSRENALPLADVTGGEKGKITVWGHICEANWRQNQAGRFDGTFVITDMADSLRIRLPYQEAKREDLEVGSTIVARGRTDVDRFDGDPLVVVTNKNEITICEPEVRDDPSPEKRVELHLHTKMSAMDSVLNLERAVSRAKEWGFPAIAVTDHGVVQSFPDAYRFGQQYGVKIIYGVEAYMIEDDDPKGHPFHVVLLAKSRVGLRHMYEIITESHLKHFYRTPRVPRGLLQAKREGLLVSSACEAGEVYKAVLQGKSEDELRRIASFYDYLEIQPVDNNGFLVDSGAVKDKQELFQINKAIYDLSRAIERPCVMTCDVHYLDPDESIYRTVLLAGKGMANGEKPTPVYLRTTAELLDEASSYLGDEAAKEVVVTNTRAIADSADELRPVLEGSHFPSLIGADEILREETDKGARAIYGEHLPELVEQRLEQELNAIIGNGYASLYVIAIRMVRKSLSDGYLVGSRGSVGSSLVATCTGITEVNPLTPHYVCPRCRWNDFEAGASYGSGFDLPARACPDCGADLCRDGQDIPFESFMGFQGEKVPDIDLNFSGEEQGEMFRFAEELLGKKNVFRAGTIGTIARKTAFGFVKHFAEDRGKNLRRAEEVRLSLGIEGVKRTTGQHPGGVMVIPEGRDILDFTPVQYPADDRQAGAMTTHFDYAAISGHLVKVDILGHDDPTVIKMLHDLTGVDPTTVPLDDPATMRLFSGDNPDDALGIPEFGTRFVRNMLSETKPCRFADLVRISGLSHGTDVWANNARDLIKEGTATLDQVIATREDIFQHLMKLGVDPAVAFGIAEKVRKGKAPSDEDLAIMREAGTPEWYIGSCLKISYLFPKAHAAAYVTMAFRIAYFKVHHPEAFAAAYFTFHGASLTTELIRKGEEYWRRFVDRVNGMSGAKAKEMNQASALEVALDMKKRGVEFGLPSLNASNATKYALDGNTLIPPFTSIPGLGGQAASAIVNAKEDGEFTSIDNFRKRTKLGKKICETLKNEGVLAGLPEGDQPTLF
jgi:DNA polymerase-3 subunit alpha (Gram-positive type)